MHDEIEPQKSSPIDVTHVTRCMAVIYYQQRDMGFHTVMLVATGLPPTTSGRG